MQRAMAMPDGDQYVFDEFPWQPGELDARRERLCPEAGRSRERVHISCRLEGASFAPAEAPPKDEIVIVAYNVERGFRAAEQVELLLSGLDIPPPDVLLLNEVDRGCSRTGYRNVARDYARGLGMCYVFGVEFVELPRLWGAGGRVARACEHGNAIVSRYPLGNARLIRHRSNKSWYSTLQRTLRLGEPRLGGRMALAADVKVGDSYLHLYGLHFESGRANGAQRIAQAEEIAADAASRPFAAIAGGDTNAGGYLRGGASGEPVAEAFFRHGFVDAHASLPPSERATTRSGVVIDLVLGKGVEFAAAGVGSAKIWDPLSDHRPVWARVRLR